MGTTYKSAGRKGSRWRTVRKQAYERDRKRDAPCHICNMPIDYLAPAGTPDAWEPDHLVPVSERPELGNEITNIAPSHASCNRSRGNRSADSGIGTPSRDWFA